MQIDVDSNVQQFLNGKDKNRGRNPGERYASFDYCYNYFQGFRDNGLSSSLCDSENLQVSCLQLGFYLASWGMLRGSSFLLEKSAKHFEETIRSIAHCDSRLWSIDADDYSEENIDLLLAFKTDLVASLGQKDHPSDILITKIMLGVFGNTPAFDTYFCAGLGISAFDKESLLEVADFYTQHKGDIDKHVVYSLDFETGRDTTRLYTKAKMIDMIGFIEGQNHSKR